jgi:integrase
MCAILYYTTNRLVEKHIKPAIGFIKLCKLQTGHLQNLYSEKMKDGARADNRPGGLSPKTVRHIHTVIHSSLEQAFKERIIPLNVADAVVLPKNPRKEMKTLDKEGVAAFLKEAKTSRYYTAFLLTLATGLRRGELLGLRWKEVDLENGLINVTQQLVRVAGGNEFTDLKTRLSKRRVVIG